MKDFEKDYKNLIDFNEQRREALKLKEKLDKELQEKCSNFIKKYTLENKMRNLGSLSSLLNENIDVRQLTDLLEKSDQWGIMSLLPRIKNHMSGVKLDNELLNYNVKVLQMLQEQFNTVDSIEYNDSCNDLFLSHAKRLYLINNDLEYLLKNGYNLSNKNNHNNFVYLVVFDTIKKGNSHVLVYNYTEYNAIFLHLLYVYAILEQKSLSWSRKGFIASDYFFVVDKELRNKYPFLSQYDHLLNNDYDLYNNIWINFVHLVKTEVKGNLIHLDFEDMGKLIKNLLSKNSEEILKILDKKISLEEVYEKIKYLHKERTYNYLSRFLFLVSDLQGFINSIKENKVDENVNQGHRTSRGKHSRMNHILDSIDKGFRISMFNHNRKYLQDFVDSNEKYQRYIPKSCFSWDNIHTNLSRYR